MRRVPLKELLELSDAGVWGDEDPEKGISVLRSTNFQSDGRIDFDNLAFRAIAESKRLQKTLREGDILLEKSGGGPKQPVGRVCLFRGHEQSHVFGNFLSRLRPKREVVEPEYLFYRLWHFHAGGLTSSYQKQTSGIRNLESKRYLELPIEVPHLSEQRRIVDLLSRAENIVRMRQEAERKAREIIPALFLDMFGDPATNAHGQESADGWETVTVERLGDLAEVVSGVAKGRKLVGKATREVPYLRVANVQAGGLNLSEMKYIPATEDEIEELAVRAGDVLLTEGGDFDKVGRGALLEADIGECIHQNHVFRVRVNPRKLVPEYLAAFLQTNAARRYFLKAAKKTSNLASINMTQLKNLSLRVPRLDRQEEFQARFRICRSLEQQEAGATEIAGTSFQSLLAGVFGEGR